MQAVQLQKKLYAYVVAQSNGIPTKISYQGIILPVSSMCATLPKVKISDEVIFIKEFDEITVLHLLKKVSFIQIIDKSAERIFNGKNITINAQQNITICAPKIHFISEKP